jgi:hypothetical protein
MDEPMLDNNKSEGSSSKDGKTEISLDSFNRMILILGAILPSITSILVTFITVTGNLVEIWISNSHTPDNIKSESNKLEANDAINEITVLQNDLNLYRERIEAGDLSGELSELKLELEFINLKIEKMQSDLGPNNPLHLNLEELKEDSDELIYMINQQDTDLFAKPLPVSILAWIVFSVSIFFVSRVIFVGLFRRKFKPSVEN